MIFNKINFILVLLLINFYSVKCQELFIPTEITRYNLINNKLQ